MSSFEDLSMDIEYQIIHRNSRVRFASVSPAVSVIALSMQKAYDVTC